MESPKGIKKVSEKLSQRPKRRKEKAPKLIKKARARIRKKLSQKAKERVRNELD